MASAMSEQAKWTTKIGVNDAISRSVKAGVSSVDTIGGTASDTRTIQNKKKKCYICSGFTDSGYR